MGQMGQMELILFICTRFFCTSAVRMSELERRMQDVLKSGRSGVFGGYSRSACAESVCKYVLHRYSTTKTAQALQKIAELPKQETKKRKLTPFENFTDTTSIDRCSVLIVVPNIGMVSVLVRRLLGGKKEKVSSKEEFYGDQGDDFLIGLKHVGAPATDRREGEGSEEGALSEEKEKKEEEKEEKEKTLPRFEEASHFSADVIIATTKNLMMMGNRNIDVEKHGITTEEELGVYKRDTKLERGMYSFLSGVDTTIFMDTDVLQLQNIKSLRDIVHIVKETSPTTKKSMHLKYLSSGEEKKQFLFLSRTLTSDILNLAENLGTPYTVEDAREKRRVPGVGASTTLLVDKRGTDSESSKYAFAKHHIERMLETVDNIKLFVVLKDAEEVKHLKEAFEGTMLLASSIFFIDEHTSRNRIKEQIKGKTKSRTGQKKVWAITERFVFYRKKRLASLLEPFGATHVFSPNIPLLYTLDAILPHTEIPCTLSGASKHQEERAPSSSVYSSPVVLVYSKNDKWAVESLTGKPFVPEKAFEYFDYVVFPPQ
ncbi:hypothetical protein NECID01_0017 [Nematocida sp. AWRm77]|nr:hypothetical protein NECID01_0017 [Nematocida sp. AWRm77]